MALVLADRVNEVSTTTGTGDFILAGAVTSFQSFNSAIGVGNTTYYTIECIPTGQWETGLGTLLGATTLQRTTVYASSSAGSLVNFSAGTKNVFVDLSATKWTSGNLVVGNGGTGSSTAQGASESLSTTYTVDNLASLKALTTRPSSVFMKGYSTPNDGGEGIWEWVAGSTATANDGTIVQCTSGTAGRYFRVFRDTIRPEWFGAKGDGVTIDTSAFNSAIAACNNQSLLLDPAKVGYPIAVTIGSTSGCTGMTSDGGRARLVRPSTATISTNIIYCQRGDFEIENLFFDLPISTDPAVSPLVSYAFRVDLSGSAGRVVFNNNRVKGGRGCVATYGTGAVETYVTNNVLEQFWDEALTIWVNKNVHITGNTIQDGGYSFPGGSGAIRTSAASGVTSENIVIANNIIKNCLVPGGQSSIDCYAPSGARNISITGNICDLNGGGIELKTDNSVPADNAYKNILVADNTVRLLNTPSFNQIGLALNFATSGTADGKASEILISGNQILMDAPPTSGAPPFYGIVATCYDNVTIVGNSIINTARGIEIAPINTVSAIMRNMSIAGNTVKVTGAGIYSQNPGTIENLQVTNNNVEAGAAFFFTTATTNKAYIANNFGKSSDTYAALRLTNCVDSLITGNTFECDAAFYGIYVNGSGTSGVIVSNNNIKTNATTGLEAIRVDAGNSITLLSNQISVSDSRASYTGAGTITAANNVRGTKTGTPTTAGSVGDVWLNSTPSLGSAQSWVCTTAGSSGVAVYTPSILGPLTVGTSTISGGTSGRVLYDNAGVLGEYTITGTAGNVVMSVSPTLTGQLSLAQGSVGTPSRTWTGTSLGEYASTGSIYYTSGSVRSHRFYSGGSVTLTASGAYAWSSTSDADGTPDLILYRDATNTLAQRNGTNAQTFRIYNTYTDASNYERGNLVWSGNTLSLITTNAGTGAARDIVIGSGSVPGASPGGTNVTVAQSGVSVQRDSTSNSTQFTVGGTGLTSTAQLHTRLTPTINQASGTYTVLDINPTETAIGAGPHYLIKGRIGAGANVFSVDRAGNFTSAATVSGVSIQAGAAGQMYFNARSILTSPADGNLCFTNQAQTDFGLLQFGGTTSSFPALKRSTTVLKVRLADDSADAAITALNVTSTGSTWANIPAAGTAGRMQFVSNAGTTGSMWLDDGTRWKPLNGIATLATLDTASSAIGNTETIVFQYLIPATMWQVGDRIRIYSTFVKSGTTDTGIIYFRIGTAGTTADTTIISSTQLTAGNRQIGNIWEFRLESATSLQPIATSAGGYGGVATSTAQPAPSTISSATANALYLSVSIKSGGATDTVTLVDGQMELVSKAN